MGAVSPVVMPSTDIPLPRTHGMCSSQRQSRDGATWRPITWIREQLLALSLCVLSHRSSRASIDEGGQVEETELAPCGLSTACPQAPQQPTLALLEAQTLAWGNRRKSPQAAPGAWVAPLRDGEGSLRSFPCLLCLT